jgi:hypothetical protein
MKNSDNSDPARRRREGPELPGAYFLLSNNKALADSKLASFRLLAALEA